MKVLDYLKCRLSEHIIEGRYVRELIEILFATKRSPRTDYTKAITVIPIHTMFCCRFCSIFIDTSGKVDMVAWNGKDVVKIWCIDMGLNYTVKKTIP